MMTVTVLVIIYFAFFILMYIRYITVHHTVHWGNLNTVELNA
jgi:hypothetical protein